MTAPTRKVPRRIVQVAIAGVAETWMTQCEAIVLALADDGSLWSTTNRDVPWSAFPPLPDREVPADDEIPF